MKYTPFGLSLTQGQKESLGKAAHARVGVTIRLSHEQLHGEDTLGLTKRQIAHLEKKRAANAGADLNISKTQLAAQKTGGFLPLLPLILGGLAAAGSIAGGAAGIAKAVDDKKAAARAQAEVERHNREVEKQLAAGSGLFLTPSTGAACAPNARGQGSTWGLKKSRAAEQL